MENETKKIILSGIQPTGVFTLGNYLGAVRSWKQMQEDYNCYYFIADLHSMTIHIDPQKRRQQTREAFALLLAINGAGAMMLFLSLYSLIQTVV